MKVLKKIITVLFTNYPYKIRCFDQLYRNKKGEAIDVPEERPMVLKTEIGETIVYANGASFLNYPPILRKVNGQNRYELTGIFKEPDRILYKIPGGSIIGNNGFVYDAKKKSFIEESAKEWTTTLGKSPFTNMVHFPPKKALDGYVLSCLTNGADGGFYHYFFESLLKLYYCREIVDFTSYILLNGPSTQWKLNWLEKASINIDKVIWVMDTDHITCEQLMFTNRLIKDQQLSKWSINSLLQLFSVAPAVEATQNNKQVIWITRAGLKERHISWEEQILDVFPAIRCVDLTQLTPEETIHTLQEATHVISAHGAGLSNLIFCRKDTKVLEILPNGKTFQPCYSRISSVLRLNHFIVNLDVSNPDNRETGFGYLKETLCNFI
ncbi:glycosyltransferase family 61 protein [Pedobacter frigidisoli]|uniref:glycosyltransferase family 61 protein n=1 Tax=Pedobacter frigidisoli TaxID=2530455 RepID=UPI00292EED6F|nr:glycosyltransferase family 61 protein [Pedobacter frigidisoli]